MKATYLIRTGLLIAGCGFNAAAFADDYSIQDLGNLGGATSHAFGLNALGEVAAISDQADAAIRAYFWNGAATPIAPAAGDLHTQGFAINDAGQVAVSSFTLGSIVSHGLLWQNGSSISLGDFAPHGLNAGGTVVGHVTTYDSAAGWFDRPARWQAGALTTLPTLGGEYGYAAAVNEAGHIVGWTYTHGNASVRATLWQNSAAVDLGTLGGTGSMAYDISETGFAAGVADTVAGEPHACRFTIDAAGNVLARTDLGVLGGGASYGYSANNAGDVVGSSHGHAFLWTSGAIADLNDLLPANSGWVLENAWAINDSGQIVGSGVHDGQVRAFLLSPDAGSPADLNGDGHVDLDDLSILLLAFGTCAGDPLYNPVADIVPNGCVDLDDLSALLVDFGT